LDNPKTKLLTRPRPPVHNENTTSPHVKWQK